MPSRRAFLILASPSVSEGFTALVVFMEQSELFTLNEILQLFPSGDGQP